MKKMMLQFLIGISLLITVAQILSLDFDDFSRNLKNKSVFGVLATALIALSLWLQLRKINRDQAKIN